MTTITKERIELFIKNPLENGLTRGEQMELARIALVVLTAEPVAWMCEDEEGREYNSSNEFSCGRFGVPLYAAPPALVVPDERAAFNAWNNEDNLPIAGVGAKNAAWLAWQARASLCGNSALNVSPERPADSSNGDDVEAWFDEGWNACRAAMLQGSQPVSQTYNLPELIEGMEVSIDVSTCDADAGNRYFGTVTEVSELDTAKNGYILLVQDAEPNFDVNGNSPVIPEGLVKAVHFYEQAKRENPPIETGVWKDAIDWVLKEACLAASTLESSREHEVISQQEKA
ncbi:TPA: DUF551 domain-containing protein [Salmonella enterica subsp. enterica serovar Heidelberg]